jgi:hypothetical protein
MAARRRRQRQWQPARGRRTAERDRPARGRRPPRLRMGDARAARTPAQLLAGVARRAHGQRRGDLVGRRRAARQRRLGEPAPCRHRTADPRGARGRRDHGTAARHPVRPRRRRRLLLPPARPGCGRRVRHSSGRQGRRGCPVAAGLDRPGHQRHLHSPARVHRQHRQGHRRPCRPGNAPQCHPRLPHPRGAPIEHPRSRSAERRRSMVAAPSRRGHGARFQRDGASEGDG